MEYRLPYYMAYPMPLLYDDGREERRDYEYMQSMYPNFVKRILPYVEDECERGGNHQRDNKHQRAHFNEVHNLGSVFNGLTHLCHMVYL